MDFNGLLNEQGRNDKRDGSPSWAAKEEPETVSTLRIFASALNKIKV